MIIDFGPLRGKMREKGYTQEKLAKAIGMAPSSLNLKLNNKRDFTILEALIIAKVLGIREMEPYFFTEKLAKPKARNGRS